MSPGDVDPRVVRRHLLALRATVATLRRHTGLSPEVLETDDDERWTVERGLQLAAQNVLDVATHIAAGEGRDVPDYASAIGILGALGVLPRALSEELAGLAGFRNVLVHGYLDVDVDRVHRLLNDRLGDFELFARHVERYLGGREG